MHGKTESVMTGLHSSELVVKLNSHKTTGKIAAAAIQTAAMIAAAPTVAATHAAADTEQNTMAAAPTVAATHAIADATTAVVTAATMIADAPEEAAYRNGVFGSRVV